METKNRRKIRLSFEANTYYLFTNERRRHATHGLSIGTYLTTNLPTYLTTNLLTYLTTKLPRKELPLLFVVEVR